MSEVVATQQQGLTGKYHSYPEYKDSGIAWLGNAPSHWAVFHGKRLLTQCRETARPESTQLAASQAYGVIPQSLLMEMTGNKVMLALKGTDNFKHVSENDFVISLRSFEGGIEHSSYSGCVSPAYTVLQAVKPIYPWFYRYLFKSSPYIAALQASTDSLRDGKSITFEQFGAISLPLPSHEEQRTIAAFLDYETARIDRLIAQQQRLIELLKEKRQAVISHAITKGLNPNAPMKDSGVEWLGQVPEHWGVSALGYYSMLNTGATPDRSKNQYWGGTIPWIKTGEVRYDTIYETEETITQAALSETSVRLSKPGTLLMAMYGQGITRGRVAILGVSATYNQACVAITPNSKLTNDFLKFFFMAGYDALRDGGNETSQMNLNADIVSKFKVLVPSYEEQIDIVSFLRIKLAHYEQLINKSEHAIALMQERRTALISAAVTGKIDLRGWEPPAEEAAA
ncbi:restriction endonuclease subunit S [Aeromonas hydrophila]|uniref:restriction endonuclease subunit S n=1 Tax=Aeromonas TaxID=642 RepID=UPI0009B84DD8|nr:MULTISPECIES: restriction endonuclease subunit S [Aeromonas]MDE8809751.1 restriction endonuclease subunit S [Aeromonas hydrophila]BDO08860.1 restriction modification system DNA specificity domain-containing protein [Aeromonas caviae]BDS30791.1 restriction modification system DNA specificity domain-containing protein [Aeromonas caviae]